MRNNCCFYIPATRAKQKLQQQEETIDLDFGYEGDLKLDFLLVSLSPKVAKEITKCWLDPDTIVEEQFLGKGCDCFLL